MIWYPQWLQWRYGVLAVTAFCLFAIATGLPAIGESDTFDLQWIAVFGVWSGYFTGFLAAGNGIRAHWLPRYHPYTYFVLSLPVSRRKLVLTSVLTAALIAVAINSVIAGPVVLWMGSQEFAFSSVSLINILLLSQANAIAVTLAFAALATLLGRFWFFAISILFAGSYAIAANHFASAIAANGMSWAGLAMALAFGAAGITLSLVYAPTREY